MPQRSKWVYRSSFSISSLRPGPKLRRCLWWLRTAPYIPLLHTYLLHAYHCCIHICCLQTTAAYIHCCSQRLQCRTAASAVEVQGSVYVLGGYNPKDFPADNNRLDLVERYDVHTDSWEQVFSFAMYCYVVSSPFAICAYSS